MTLMARQHGILFLIHYLGDFLTMGPPSSPPCKHNLDKLVQICNYVGISLKKLDHTDATKWGILSLVGSLQHATKVVRYGFCSRMYVTAAKLKEMHFHTRLNTEFRSDHCWWHTFLAEWNNLSLLHWGNSN